MMAKPRIRATRKNARFTWISLMLWLSGALLSQVVSAHRDHSEQEAAATSKVVNMQSLQAVQLDQGCLNIGGTLKPPGCSFDPSKSITIRGLTADTVRLQHMIIPKGAESPPHSHPDEELFYILSGSIKVTGGSDQYTVSAGDVFIVPAYVAHHFVALEDSTFIEVGGPGPLLNMPGLKKMSGRIALPDQEAQ